MSVGLEIPKLRQSFLEPFQLWVGMNWLLLGHCQQVLHARFASGGYEVHPSANFKSHSAVALPYCLVTLVAACSSILLALIPRGWKSRAAGMQSMGKRGAGRYTSAHKHTQQSGLRAKIHEPDNHVLERSPEMRQGE